METLRLVGPGGARAQASVAALGRHAAARGHRARAGRAARGAAHGRAVQRARRAHARKPAGPAAAAVVGARADRRFCHARHRRVDLSLRRDRGAVARAFADSEAPRGGHSAARASSWRLASRRASSRIDASSTTWWWPDERLAREAARLCRPRRLARPVGAQRALEMGGHAHLAGHLHGPGDVLAVADRRHLPAGVRLEPRAPALRLCRRDAARGGYRHRHGRVAADVSPLRAAGRAAAPDPEPGVLADGDPLPGHRQHHEGVHGGVRFVLPDPAEYRGGGAQRRPGAASTPAARSA